MFNAHTASVVGNATGVDGGVATPSAEVASAALYEGGTAGVFSEMLNAQNAMEALQNAVVEVVGEDATVRTAATTEDPDKTKADE